jgi:hypothetical protein
VAQAIVARRDGDAFQARLFWGRAARLLDPHGHVRRVGFESGPGGFDDIWVEYESGHGPLDPEGVALGRVHMQCKWHVAPGAYGYAALADPEFINAKSRSLLQRAREAQIAHAPDGRGIRFQLTTNWGVDHKDPLRAMIASRSSAMVAARLFEGKTDRGQAGQVRRLWRDHLAIDDDELRRLAQTLAFGQVPDSLDALREQLNLVFRLVGLRSIPQSDSGFIYDDVVFQWLAQGRLEFDRQSFRAACAKENLIGPAAGGPKIYGVKSFEHPFDRLEERCDKVLSLVQHFDDRYIHSQDDWSTILYPELRAFLASAAQESPQLRLALDAHVTLAFAAGSVLDIKSGRRVEIEQRTLDRRVWSADDVAVDPAWPRLVCAWTEIDPAGHDLAVAVGLTHDIEAAVRGYVAGQAGVRGLLLCSSSGGSGARTVECGAHAAALAEAVVAESRARSQAGGRVHLFIAGPNAFSFFLGQRRVALGPVTLYEFDFEGGRSGGYEASLSVPL